jgi:hypothetical protein|tara:strand:- start:164 stop:598 length:435 start_codon:yes stop_codon:yes gene_type:complete
MKTPKQQIKIYRQVCRDLEKIILIQEKYITLLDNKGVEVLNRMLNVQRITDFLLTSLQEKNGEIEDLNKRYFEMIRAYNSLAEFSKSAEEFGIDVESHRSRLPENQVHDFKIGQTVLESGKVRSWMSGRIEPKKKKKRRKKKQQ